MMEKSEIQERLTRNHSAFTGFVGQLSDVLVNNAMPGKWTPIQQMSHISKSVAPVNFALTLPKFSLRIIFGKANRPSRSYDELITRYKGKLEAGGKSATRFLPDRTCDRRELVQSLENNVASLVNKMNRFSEQELDKYILPHPLLGKLTLREMLYFTIYHVEHHHAQINPALRQSAA